MISRNRTIGMLVVLGLFLGVSSACGGTAPQVGKISVDPGSTIYTGETATLSVTASGANLTFEWTATRGTITSPAGSSAVYTAPDTPGSDTVTVEVTGGTSSIFRKLFSGGNSTFKNVTLEIIPPPVDTPTPTVTPSHPVPLLEIFPQVGEGSAFYWNTGGEFVARYVEEDHCRHEGPYGLRMEYDMRGEAHGGWGVQWVSAPAGHFDASATGRSSLTFWVRGTRGGELFQLGLKDTSGNEFKIESENLVVISSTEWRQVSVDLSDFTGVNAASIENISFAFSRNDGEGTLCLDDVRFE